MLLPNTDGATLLLVAERIRGYVESMCFDENRKPVKNNDFLRRNVVSD